MLRLSTYPKKIINIQKFDSINSESQLQSRIPPYIRKLYQIIDCTKENTHKTTAKTQLLMTIQSRNSSSTICTETENFTWYICALAVRPSYEATGERKLNLYCQIYSLRMQLAGRERER